ncbi:MAG: excinuclease ABC subunit UvrB [Flavobacteriales bacterium]|jgi:excinuclease ABC subunit B|tara:strand:+ start:12189 stop:14168 length:1980 start_codon:yes stop_codon:yes gene_type:complete
MNFNIVSDFSPTGDQPNAIKELVEGLNKDVPNQTLLGVTGSGKTFTIANVIKEVNRPTLILSHNKTLAAQLYSEFKQFFPNNAVEYFVSYYDYYQPEAYIPSSGIYIEKDLSINQEIEKLRLSTTSTLLSGRKDIIVVCSVSCIYGIGNPEEFSNNVIEITKGQVVSRNKLLNQFVTSLYSRSENQFERGNFKVKGDTIDIFPAYADIAYRIHFWGDEIEDIESIDPANGKRIEKFDYLKIYPATIFVASKDKIQSAIHQIQDDLMEQVQFLHSTDRKLEAKRLEERVNYDLEMIRELGYCSGIENYSRYFDGRDPGSRPFCLLDYFPSDFLTVIDESHVTLPQIRAMFGGDRSRKENLVDYGFRLPAAMDNRPLKFDEFELINNQTIYVSATPADYELQQSEGIFVEQVIRPTGLLDPVIEVRPSVNQIDDLLEEIRKRVLIDERVLVTTLTKRMAEELTKYLTNFKVKCRYIHSDVDTLERVEILHELREGHFDVLIGVNLLREGLDLPEVSLVAILDADKEGFLRSERSLTQTAGRAARNINGLVIMYADKVTRSMKLTIDETNRRREIQMQYNTDNNMVPTALKKKKNNELAQKLNPYAVKEIHSVDESDYSDPKMLDKAIRKTQKMMEKAAQELDFDEAIILRDRLKELKDFKK